MESKKNYIYMNKIWKKNPTPLFTKHMYKSWILHHNKLFIFIWDTEKLVILEKDWESSCFF